MSYQLKFSSSFEKQLKKLHPKDAKRIVEEIKSLQADPFPKGKKVKNLVGVPNAWRIRSGKVRAIYFVDETIKTIFIEDVAYRKDIY